MGATIEDNKKSWCKLPHPSILFDQNVYSFSTKYNSLARSSFMIWPTHSTLCCMSFFFQLQFKCDKSALRAIDWRKYGNRKRDWLHCIHFATTKQLTVPFYAHCDECSIGHVRTNQTNILEFFSELFFLCMHFPFDMNALRIIPALSPSTNPPEYKV